MNYYEKYLKYKKKYLNLLQSGAGGIQKIATADEIVTNIQQNRYNLSYILSYADLVYALQLNQLTKSHRAALTNLGIIFTAVTEKDGSVTNSINKDETKIQIQRKITDVINKAKKTEDTLIVLDAAKEEAVRTAEVASIEALRLAEAAIIAETVSTDAAMKANAARAQARIAETVSTDAAMKADAARVQADAARVQATNDRKEANKAKSQ